MADSKSSTVPSMEKIYGIDWNSSDDTVIAQMHRLIDGLNNKIVEATTILSKLDIGFGASVHTFGMNGRDRCEDEVVSTWLALLVTLASSEGVTGCSLVSSFAKSCGGCMAYQILMTVGCFHSNKNVQLAFDFFRYVLADPSGEILELSEVSRLSSLVADTIPARRDGYHSRQVCLELSCYERIWDMEMGTKKIIEGLRHLIEGLGVLCTSESFVREMKTNRTATLEILKQSIMNHTFSREFASKQWR